MLFPPNRIGWEKLWVETMGVPLVPHSMVRKLVEDYFRDRLHDQPAFPYLKPNLPSTMILVTGSYSFAMSRSGSDLDVEVIVPDELYPSMVQEAGGPRGLWAHDVAHNPLVDVKIRPIAWLRRRLSGDDPEALWIYQHAVLVQDPDARMPSLMAQAIDGFKGQVAELVVARYREFRSAVTLEHSREELCRQILLGKAIESALVLPLLARNEPYPYPKWQSWWLAKSHTHGTEIIRLCQQILAKEDIGPEFKQLRRIMDDLLIEAGYGDSLVRDFWRKL